MSNQDIRDRLEREGETWIERERARIAMAKEKADRHARNREVACLFARAGAAIFVLCGALWILMEVYK